MPSGNPVLDSATRKSLKAPVFNNLYEKRAWMLEHMAGVLRIFGRKGYNEGCAGHVTIVDPVDPTSYWINPVGVHFSMITVRDLVHVNAKGEAIGGSEAPFSLPGFKIHSQMHKARPEISSICHAHTFYARTFSVFGKKLEMMSQDSCLVHNNYALMADYSGVGLDEVEGDKVSKALGDKMAILLQNHGLMTVGKTVDEAGYLLILLENMCKAQLLADAAAGNSAALKHIIPDNVAKSAFDVISGPDSLYAALQPDYELEVYLSKGDFL
ncbi:KLTH0E03278p [Lachancea thermotolerans CBS 6340]|uniref:KLTH0E03278p n=1 Tax=Lachancea thermotolerans (strain ATCC 56472 / CBS 6340 / NRRL Y-8284) TaxID=559295 RepID=C5DHC9_LACTC|nr:KLTH0E03278p [Lachancea thermotolerans CBS 6340]CAR23190.1 KLTH0E03278p [Lachancea thermotolerans CBS 6340]